MTGWIIKNIPTQSKTKMENPKKKNAPNTSITLKDCIEDPNWQAMYELIKRDTKYRLQNHFYDD